MAFDPHKLFFGSCWDPVRDEIAEIIRDWKGCVRTDNSFQAHYAAYLKETGGKTLSRRRLGAFLDCARLRYYAQTAMKRADYLTDKIAELKSSGASSGRICAEQGYLRNLIQAAFREMKSYDEAYLKARDLALLLHPDVKEIRLGKNIIWPNIPEDAPVPNVCWTKRSSSESSVATPPSPKKKKKAPSDVEDSE